MRRNMAKLSALALVVLIAVIPAIAAKGKKVEVPGAKLTLAVPENWTEERDFMNVPLVLFGPMADGSRPVIQVVDSGVPTQVDPIGLKNTEGRYQSDRADWVKANLGQVIKF